MTVRKRGSKFVVTTKNGKRILGTHPTRAAANKQLRAIEANKKRGK